MERLGIIMKFLDAEFVQGFIRMADDGWQQGWHERNGGNLSYRVKPEEVELVKENFEPKEFQPIGTTVPALAGEYFLVTGSGKYFRNVSIKPEDSICMIELDDKGENYRIVWGLVNGGRPTSELPSHLMNLEVKKLQDPDYRVVYHAHTTNIIALTFVLPLEDKVFTRELWEMATECPVVFPDGVGVVPWRVPGGREIAVATSELMKKYDLAIWAHHGTFAAGKDFDLTFGLMHTVEKSAEILVKMLSMHEIIMGYQGEMSLKGLNRNQFESAMMKILRYRLKTVGKFKVYCTQSTFYMEPEEEDVDMDLAFDRVSKVFGLAALSRAVVCDKDFDTICQTAEDYLGASLHGIRTFKVEARRSDKTYPMTSPELMRELGAYLLGKHNYLKVDVHNPDFKVIVEIRDYGAYIHGPKVPGEGGLPVGTSGRALNMLSGGIDSPVAAYRMAKRGLALDHIHFASPPYTSERAKLKVKALAQLTSIYTGSSNLFVVPYTKPQEYIRDNAPDVLFTVLMRRSMMRIANVIAKKQGCEALVTGESLAQVASQTVKALQCTDAAQDLPILRPLIGMDKTEIVETARHINTFETSILPYEDCCTIFTPPHPKIRPELEEILEAEAAMPGLAALEAEAAESAERIRIRITDQVEFEG